MRSLSLHAGDTGPIKKERHGVENQKLNCKRTLDIRMKQSGDEVVCEVKSHGINRGSSIYLVQGNDKKRVEKLAYSEGEPFEVELKRNVTGRCLSVLDK